MRAVNRQPWFPREGPVEMAIRITYPTSSCAANATITTARRTAITIATPSLEEPDMLHNTGTQLNSKPATVRTKYVEK